MTYFMSLLFAMSLVFSSIGYASELKPWEVEDVPIKASGTYSVPIDSNSLIFEMPDIDGYDSGYAKEVVTRNEASEKYLKISYGHFTKACFGMHKNFYPLAIPLFGIDAQFHLAAQVHVMSSVATRAAFVDDTFKGDFSKPAELKAYLERNRGVSEHSTPVEEVVINGRKWYRYWWNSPGYPDDLREVYITGLAPDRFLEVYVRQYPVPFVESRYPTYPAEDRMPRWMKETHKFKEQVIHSLRISHEAEGDVRDLYEVDVADEREELKQVQK